MSTSYLQHAVDKINRGKYYHKAKTKDGMKEKDGCKDKDLHLLKVKFKLK
jgi:hypothetical protein